MSSRTSASFGNEIKSFSSSIEARKPLSKDALDWARLKL